MCERGYYLRVVCEGTLFFATQLLFNYLISTHLKVILDLIYI